MSNERDELGKLLFTLPVSDRAGGTAPEIMTLCDEAAESILESGYRKPRTITTAEELDALPAKSAILDRNGTPWVGDGDKVEPWASVCEDPYGGPVWKNSVDIELPATVLHEPEATS